jgi:hypothetical protein
MLKRILSTAIFFIIFLSAGFAQQYLFGRVFKKGNQEILRGVSVQNFSTKKYNKSDLGGNYRIAATAGDTVIFSSAGYLPDTFFLSGSAPAGGYNMLLAPNVVALPGVEIDELSKYEADSIERRKDYAFILDRKHPVKLMNEKRQEDAPGLNFSPIGYFSKGEKQKRKLKKRVIEEDEEEYIDARFPRSRVAFLTRLTGDSLQQFMLRYRPSYKFCRATDNQKMFLYINDKLVLFMKSKNKQQDK